MPESASDTRRQRRNGWAIVALILALVAAGLAYLVWREHDLTIAREQDRLVTLSHVVDENLSQQLLSAHAALTNVRDDMLDVTSSGRESQLFRRLKALTDAMPGVGSMLVTDAWGKVLASSQVEMLGLYVAQRSYFQIPKAQPVSDTTYVSEPFETAPGILVIQLTKVWFGANGQFGGIVTAALDPNYFDVLLRSVLYTPDARSTLIHGNGRVFISRPSPRLATGFNLTGGPSLFEQHRQSGRSETLVIGKAYATGDERIVAMRTSQPASLHMDHALVAALSRPLDAVLAPWRRLTTLYLALYGLLAAMLGGATFMLQRRRDAVLEVTQVREREARQHAEWLDLALGGANLGLWDLDVATGARAVNARAKQMVGDLATDPADDLNAWMARMHPDDRANALEARVQHQTGVSEFMVMDYRMRHRDGSWVWLQSRGKVAQRGADASPLRLVGTYMDVTEHKAAEAEIRRSAELLARMSRVSRTGGWDHDLATGRSTWSPEMFRIRELDPSVQPDQQLVMSAYLPESQQRLAAARAAAIEHGTPWDMELQMITATGKLIWVRSQGEAVVEHGKTVGLTGTLKNVTWRKQSQIELKIANEKLEQLALTDSLTGIANRRLFDQTLQLEWARSARTGQTLALLMIDIDHFKLYNDFYGHAAGDLALQRVAQVLGACARRPGDLVCRFGGEEFAMLLPGADVASASVIAQGCLDALAHLRISHGASPSSPWLSLSIGVASLLADPALSAQELVEHADQALYQAKDLGRARYQAMHPSLA